MMDLSARASCLGVLPVTVGHPWSYFEQRGATIECLGPLEIDKCSHWGYLVTVLTRSHDIVRGPSQLGPVVMCGVYVESGAWICSQALLHNCRIGMGSIVTAGTVVRGQNVGPHVIVAGNPARVIARWDGKQWVCLPGEQTGFYRRLF